MFENGQIPIAVAFEVQGLAFVEQEQRFLARQRQGTWGRADDAEVVAKEAAGESEAEGPALSLVSAAGFVESYGATGPCRPRRVTEEEEEEGFAADGASETKEADGDTNGAAGLKSEIRSPPDLYLGGSSVKEALQLLSMLVRQQQQKGGEKEDSGASAVAAAAAPAASSRGASGGGRGDAGGGKRSQVSASGGQHSAAAGRGRGMDTSAAIPASPLS